MPNKLFLIGIDNYAFQKELKSSVKGITDIKNVLFEKFDFQIEETYELKNEEATNINIQNAFRKYVTTLKEDDNLIIIFSGHGEYEKATDIGYWVPYDAKDYTNFISNQTLIKYIEGIKCKHIFIISDSCFSNSLLLTSRTKSLEEYFEKKSRWALTSAYNESKDSDELSNTLFCEYILNFLEDAENDFRVNELIEFVKSKFLINVFQKPQGAPLQIIGHEGGEFVFKIKTPIDRRKFKGYNGFERILSFYRHNSTFKEVSKFEDRTNKIGYHLMQEMDNVLKKATYYLYLYEGTNQTQTFNHIKEKHPTILKDRTLVVFITAERHQKNRETRKKNIQEKFKPINIFYIDEFIKNHCTPKIIGDDDSRYLNISNFILPPFKSSNDNLDIKSFFNDWYDKVEEPILVIKGSGGIGKTTLAQYFADNLLTENPNHYVLFIDSVQIKDSLLKSKNRDNLSIYNFYEALFDITDNLQEKLSEELFKINLDAGNILVLIDGLDEVISKIPNFNVTEFINSIKNASNELGNGKVIITCRTYFWDKTDFPAEHFRIIELEPFSENQAKEFFNKSFQQNEKKTNKALKLASDFKFPNSEKEYIFHPYVLDIIRSIIDSESEQLNIQVADLHSNYLKQTIKGDYILYRVCEREKIRVGQIDVDKQTKFFINFSVEKRGIIKQVDLKNFLEVSIEEKVDNTTVEAFKSHPFLKILDNSLVFRYDFLADIYKGIFMSNFFNYQKGNIKITKPFIDILNESCWYGSALNIEIVNRIVSWTEDDLLLVSDIINQVKNDKSLTEDLIRKSIANIFNLSLTINGKFKDNNITNNTNLMKNLFESGRNRILNLNILNINTDQNIKLDFSDLTIENALIDNYNNFWKCNFNEKTQFMNCVLLNIKVKTTQSSINKNNFVDCTFDSGLEDSLKITETVIQNYTESLKIFLSQFFHLFVSNGKLGRQWEHKVIMPRYSGINKLNINYNKLIKLLKKNNLITVTEELGKNKFAVSDSQKEAVNKFMKDGTLSKNIIELIEELKK